MLNYQRVIYLGWWFHDDSISPPFVGNTTPDIRSLSTPWAVVLDHLAEGGVLGASWRTWSGQKIQKEQPWSWGWFWYRYFHGCREKQWVKALEMVFLLENMSKAVGFETVRLTGQMVSGVRWCFMDSMTHPLWFNPTNISSWFDGHNYGHAAFSDTHHAYTVMHCWLHFPFHNYKLLILYRMQ